MKFQDFCRKSFGVVFSGLVVFSVSGLAQSTKDQSPTLVINSQRREMPVAGANNLYCAGYVESEKVDTSRKIVGAENEQEQFVYAQGNRLYINAGANRGVQVGDMFSVIRPRGQVETRWTKKGRLGFYVQEVGAVEVIRVKSEVAVVRVKTSCDNFLLGDLIQPIPARVSPTSFPRPVLDVFTEPTGKARGRIFMARDNIELIGREQIVYLDLGAEDGVQVGNYLTVYRPLGRGGLFISDEDEVVRARESGFESDEFRGGRFSNQAARKSGDEARGKVVTTEAA